MEPLSEATQAMLDEALDPAERVEDVVRAVGSALVLTDRRLMVIREGGRHRPVSGVRSFALGGDLNVRIGPQRKRVIIDTAEGTINLFIRSHHLRSTEAFVAKVQTRIFGE
jgi:hypothetical protein